MRCLKCVLTGVLAMSAVSVAVAAVPWNAGSKIFHQEDQRTVSRRAYSYAPSTSMVAPAVTSSVQHAPTVAAPAPIAAPSAQQRGYRSYSYQPSVNYNRARNSSGQFWKESRQ